MVSGRLSAWARGVMEGAESPRPWRRRRMFGLARVGDCCGDLWDGGGGGGGVMVRVRWEGKSESVGDFLLGIFLLYACRVFAWYGVGCRCDLPFRYSPY